MTNYLTDMINYIFKCKQIPAVLKEGIVFKKGDATDPSNYHGITVTTVLLKVFDCVGV